jgi:hypothetical protein
VAWVFTPEAWVAALTGSARAMSKRKLSKNDRNRRIRNASFRQKILRYFPRYSIIRTHQKQGKKAVIGFSACLFQGTDV